MSDDSERQITRIDGDSSLLSKAGSGLIARGRKDAAILRQPSSPAVSEADKASISQGICNKCGRRKELVLAKCVCASCSEALDRGWAGSAATDWVLVAFPGPEPPTIEGDYDTRSYRISLVAERMHRESVFREQLEWAISSYTSSWPHLYVYTKATYAEMKEHWARCNPPDTRCIGPMTVDEFYRVARYREGDELGPWPRGRGEWQDAIPHIRPATSQEMAQFLPKTAGPQPQPKSLPRWPRGSDKRAMKWSLQRRLEAAVRNKEPEEEIALLKHVIIKVDAQIADLESLQISVRRARGGPALAE